MAFEESLLKIKDETSPIRWALRRAEEIFGGTDPNLGARSDRRGLAVGNGSEVALADLLAALKPTTGDERPWVVVTLYADDCPAPLPQVEEWLAEAAQRTLLGEWLGSDPGTVAGRPYLDLQLAVESLETAIPRLQELLRDLGVGGDTVILTSEGVLHEM